eukprot:11063166-Karenia_brevis.AAC.1
MRSQGGGAEKSRGPGPGPRAHGPGPGPGPWKRPWKNHRKTKLATQAIKYSPTLCLLTGLKPDHQP